MAVINELMLELNIPYQNKKVLSILIRLLNWWCYLIFERKGCICPLLLGYFANDLYAKIVLLIVKNMSFQNIIGLFFVDRNKNMKFNI